MPAAPPAEGAGSGAIIRGSSASAAIVIYALISYAEPDHHSDALRALGVRVYEPEAAGRRGPGPVYFFPFEGSKEELQQALGLVGAWHEDRAFVSLVPRHKYWDFDGLFEWLGRHGLREESLEEKEQRIAME